mmetsp:Transcript_13893/g.25582  ORF Transcript_13893/g.25582 Transcript_13893/m.25582 type:complete len:343 (+) Transcript_13893:74-1102(+)
MGGGGGRSPRRSRSPRGNYDSKGKFPGKGDGRYGDRDGRGSHGKGKGGMRRDDARPWDKGGGRGWKDKGPQRADSRDDSRDGGAMRRRPPSGAPLQPAPGAFNSGGGGGRRGDSRRRSPRRRRRDDQQLDDVRGGGPAVPGGGAGGRRRRMRGREGDDDSRGRRSVSPGGKGGGGRMEALEERVRAARKDVAATRDRLEAAEAKAADTIARKIADLERKDREELEDIFKSMKEASDKEAEENQQELESRLRTELTAKIRELKAEYEGKIRDEVELLQKTLSSALKEAENELRESHREQLEASRKEIEASEVPTKARAAHEEASNRLAAEEDKLRMLRDRGQG